MAIDGSRERCRSRSNCDSKKVFLISSKNRVCKSLSPCSRVDVTPEIEGQFGREIGRVANRSDSSRRQLINDDGLCCAITSSDSRRSLLDSIFLMQSSEDGPPRDVHRKKSSKARRCQLIRVSGFSTTTALRQGNQLGTLDVLSRAEQQTRRLTDSARFALLFWSR